MQPLLSPSLPLPENFARIAAANPDRNTTLVVHDAPIEEDAKISGVTWTQLLADVYSRASVILQETGLTPRKLGDNPFVVGLLAQNGYEYLLTIIAMLMLRWTILPISPRNSHEAMKHLMSSVDSSHLILDEATQALMGGIRDVSFATHVVPNKPSRGDGNAEEYPRCRALLLEVDASSDALAEEARSTCLLMHTSGSTGHPKAIPWSHEEMVKRAITVTDDFPQGEERTLYTPLPLFHTGGLRICFAFILGLVGNYTFINRRQAISYDSVVRYLRILRGRSPHVVLTPNLLEDIADSDTFSRDLDTLKCMSSVIWGGSPLRQDVGDLLVLGGVRLVAWGGITEAGSFAKMSFDPNRDLSDWPYVRLVTSFTFNFKPLDENNPGMGQTLVLSPGFASPLIMNHDNPPGFLSADIWVQHPDPSKSHLWKIIGRHDDVIALSNGEKANGGQLERLLCDSPLISKAVAFGSGRFLCGVILMPSYELLPYTDEAAHQYLESVWPHISSCVNNVVPQHSRLVRSLVLVTKPDKPFFTSDKGTVKRAASISLYEKEIEEAYRQLELGAGPDAETSSASPIPMTYDAAVEFVSCITGEALGRALATDEDFFDAGLDSLLAVKLRQSVLTFLKKAEIQTIPPRNVIHTHPTIRALARYLTTAAGAGAREHISAPTHAETTRMMEEAISMFSSGFREHIAKPCSDRHLGDVYAITGTTGSLGSAFLHTLLREGHIKKVYLMNRASNSETMSERHKRIFSDKGFDYSVLEEALDSGRAVYLETELSRVDLGLHEDTYKQLAEEVTHLVHIAWPVSFSLVFSSFHTQLAGVRHLIDLALSSRRPFPPHFSFVSSIAVVGNWTPGESAPETRLLSSQSVILYGYGQAKYVAEKIVEAAIAASPGFSASIVRCSQISGSLQTGSWSRKEYIPSLLQSSFSLGMIPNIVRPMRWLPVNLAARALYFQIQEAASSSSISYYNLENSIELPWTTVSNVMVSCFPSIQRVSTDAWLEEAHKRDTCATDLLEFFEDYVFRAHPPKLQLVNASRATDSILDYEFQEDLLARYIMYACTYVLTD